MPDRVTRSVALSGQTSATPLVDVLSTVSSSGKSAEVRVRTEFGVCWIWFQDGQLVDASFNRQRGEDAVARLAGVGEARFEVEYCKVERERTIHSTVQRIFQDWANRRRLWRELVRQPPRLREVLGVVEKWRSDGERMVPESHGGLLGLFDGENTVLDAIEKLGEEAVRTLAIIHQLYDAGVLVTLRVEDDAPVSSSIPQPALPEAPASSPTSADAVWSIRPAPIVDMLGNRQQSELDVDPLDWQPEAALDQDAGHRLQYIDAPGPATIKGPPALVLPDGRSMLAARVAANVVPNTRSPSSPARPAPAVPGPAVPAPAVPAPAVPAPALVLVPAKPPEAGRERRSLTPPNLPAAPSLAPAGANTEAANVLDAHAPEQPDKRDLREGTGIGGSQGGEASLDSATMRRAAANNGRVLGRYEVLCRLGRGGMGTVYLCRTRGELGFRRLYALKVLRQRVDRDSEAEQLFLREAYVASRLHHPNVVAVLDADVHGSQPYLIMDYVEGCSLQTLLSRGQEQRSPSVVLSIIMDALNGLHAAHSMSDEAGNRLGLVHCDVSPENLLIGVEGTCRLSDFGVARAQALPGSRNIGTSTRGKARYASPEQAAGIPVDARSDVFSMGVVLYEALTGVPLFAGAAVDEILEKVLRQPILPPSQVGHQPPPELDAVCLRALERNPAQRFASAAEMLVELRRVAVQRGLLASPEEVGNWVRAVAQPELEMQRLASLDAAQHGRFQGGGDALTSQFPRALSIPPPPGGAAATAEPQELEDDPTGSDGAEHTVELKRPAKFLKAVVILASFVALGAIAVSVLFPETMARWLRLDVGEASPSVEKDDRLSPPTSAAAQGAHTGALPTASSNQQASAQPHGGAKAPPRARVPAASRAKSSAPPPPKGSAPSRSTPIPARDAPTPGRRAAAPLRGYVYHPPGAPAASEASSPPDEVSTPGPDDPMPLAADPEPPRTSTIPDTATDDFGDASEEPSAEK